MSCLGNFHTGCILELDARDVEAMEFYLYTLQGSLESALNAHDMQVVVNFP